jgi:hypothetical protein
MTIDVDDRSKAINIQKNAGRQANKLGDERRTIDHDDDGDVFLKKAEDEFANVPGLDGFTIGETPAPREEKKPVVNRDELIFGMIPNKMNEDKLNLIKNVNNLHLSQKES